MILLPACNETLPQIVDSNYSIVLEVISIAHSIFLSSFSIHFNWFPTYNMFLHTEAEETPLFKRGWESSLVMTWPSYKLKTDKTNQLYLLT